MADLLEATVGPNYAPCYFAAATANPIEDAFGFDVAAWIDSPVQWVPKPIEDDDAAVRRILEKLRPQHRVLESSVKRIRLSTAPEFVGAQLGLRSKWSANNVYEELSGESKKIRLLRMAPLSPTTSRHGFVEQFEIEDAPSYTALSYTWDNKSGWTNIWINGESFVLRQSLCTFLKIYQQRHHGEYLWIDQICINQQDKDEMNHQVAMMTAIYRQAKMVIIWLPPLPHHASSPADVAAVVRGQNPHLISRRTVRPFTTHPYWRRTWIVQEILLASALVIYWGDEIIEWRQFQTFATTFYASEAADDHNRRIDATNESPIDRHNVAKLKFFAEHAYRQTSMRPAEIIDHVLDTQCHDPRDIWYGIYGLLEEEYKTSLWIIANPSWKYFSMLHWL